LFKPKIGLDDIKGAFLVYSFKQNRIVYVSNRLLELLKFKNQNDFANKTNSELRNIFNLNVLNNIYENYEKTNDFYHLTTSMNINNLTFYMDIVVNVIRSREDKAYLMLYDETQKTLNEQKLMIRDEQRIRDRDLLISTFVDIYDSINRINLNSFEAVQILSSDDKIISRKINVDWDSYYSFIMQLISKDDYDKLKNIGTKEGLLKLKNDNQYNTLYYFTSEFDLASGNLKDDQSKNKYSLYISIKLDSGVPYAYVMIRNEELEEINESEYENSFTLYQYNYCNKIKLDYDTLQVISYTSDYKQAVVKEMMSNVSNFNELRLLYGSNYVDETDYDTFMEKTDISVVKEALSKKNYYIVRYKSEDETGRNKAMVVFLREKDENGKYNLLIGERNENDNLNDTNIRDTLTNLLTKDAFFSALNDTLKYSDKGYVIRIDIDHFSYYNSLFGHTSGDQVLVKLGKHLQDIVEKYGTYACRVQADTFYLYLNTNIETVKKCISILDFHIKEISNVFDFQTSYGVCPIKGYKNSEIIDHCIIASNYIKHKPNKSICVYDEKLTEELKFNREMVLDLAQNLKENSITIGYRKIFNNKRETKILDSDVLFNSSILNEKKLSVMKVIENNQLIIKLNKNVSDHVYKMMDECWTQLPDVGFIIYMTRLYFVNENLRRVVLDIINKSNVPNDKFIIALQSDLLENDEAFFKPLNEITSYNIPLIIDYSNSKTFNFALIYAFKVKCVKLDTKKFSFGNRKDLDLLIEIVDSIVKRKVSVIISNATNEIIDRFKDNDLVYYSKENDKLYSKEELVNEFN